jgi:xylan 1,4-beta-xylosidase
MRSCILVATASLVSLVSFATTYGQDAATSAAGPAPRTWTADNGNGTYSNPLFYEEFSDPDVIRVGDTYYLTGTTMHTMPGLPVLRSKDLVNWELASYAFDRLDLGPDFRLEDGNIYGQGIWAPCIRYHNGTFFIFSNINGHGTQVYRSKSPEGPWEHNRLGTTLYDLSVLFDGDKVYAVSGVNEISLSELNADVTDEIPGTRRVIIQRGSGMGEGLHFYKINGKYYLVSAIPGAHTPMVCARADSVDGPWEVETLVSEEAMGVPTGNTLNVQGGSRRERGGGRPRFQVVKNDPNLENGLTIHQGGIVDTEDGQWWSVIMQDHNSLGRVSCLAPITWTDGWPLFGLPGNLRRAPATWVKPDTGHEQAPKPLFTRDDNFDSGKLNPLWQWNHVPDEKKWSLSEAPGKLRLHALPAANFWRAKNTLTQRAVGPESTVTVELETAGMKPGDVAGLALLNFPYAWLGIAKTGDGLELRQFDQTDFETASESIEGERFWLRAHCNYDTEVAEFSVSTDGKNFREFGKPFTMIFQLTTFQGIRYSLFHFHEVASDENRDAGRPTADDGEETTESQAAAGEGGYADFDNFTVDESHPRGLTQPIPYGKAIRLASGANGDVLTAGENIVRAIKAEEAGDGDGTKFLVVDRGQGRVALKPVGESRFVTVAGEGEAGDVRLADGPPGDAQTFQWIDLQRGDLVLMSLATHRYLFADPQADGAVTGDAKGPRPDRKDGVSFHWSVE